VSHAVAGYVDASVAFVVEPPSTPEPGDFSGTGMDWEEDPDLARLYEYHALAGYILGTASDALTVPFEAVVNFEHRVGAVAGHLNSPTQLAKDYVNLSSAAINGAIRATEDNLGFASWVVNKVTFGAVPEVATEGLLPRVPYAFDDARSREFSSLAEDLYTVFGPSLFAVGKYTATATSWGRRAARSADKAVARMGSKAKRFGAHTRSRLHAIDWGDETGAISLGGRGAKGGRPRTHAAIPVPGSGTSTRRINVRPHASDPNWGLTRKHLDKHMFGNGPHSLRTIDPSGTTEQWRDHMQDLASRPATTVYDSGVEDVIGEFAKADGSGTFKFGIRIAPKGDGSWDLVTLLTRQS
jgi:hypothetical protein